MTQQENTSGSPTAHQRRVVGNISLSLDGRINGPGGEYDMGWVAPHAVNDTVRDSLVRMTQTTSTVLLGRKNYEGFGGYWPTVADDDHAEHRDRAFAQWLNEVEKVYFSTTRVDAPWRNSRLATADPVNEVARLRNAPGGDILAMSSTSLIRPLLDADVIDRLLICLCPEVSGGGAHLFPETMQASSWSLTDLATTGTGAVYLTYDRVRAEREAA